MTLTPLIPGSFAPEFGLTMPSMMSRRAFSVLATMAGGFVCKTSLAGAVMSWPQDADGDIFRRLQKSGFDFSKTYLVDFNIEFGTWPPPKEVVAMVKAKYGEIELGPPESGELGYIVF